MPTFVDHLRPQTGRLVASIGPRRSEVAWADLGIEDVRTGDIIKIDDELLLLGAPNHVTRGWGGTLQARHPTGATTSLIGVRRN